MGYYQICIWGGGGDSLDFAGTWTLPQFMIRHIQMETSVKIAAVTFLHTRTRTHTHTHKQTATFTLTNQTQSNSAPEKNKQTNMKLDRQKKDENEEKKRLQKWEQPFP